MTKAIELIGSSAHRIFPNGVLFVLMCASAAYLLIRKRRQEHILLAVSALVFLAVFFCPLSGLLFGRIMRDGEVYWRLFWPVPYILLIACAGTELVSSAGKKAVRVLLLAAVCAVIAAAGKPVYTQDVFRQAPTREKLPQITLTAVSVINTNAEKTGNPYKKVSAPIDIRCQIRQVDATIYCAASRYFHSADEDENDPAVYYHNIISGIRPDEKHKICSYLNYLEANYLVTRSEYGFKKDLEKGGFEPVYSQDGWEIWYNPDIKIKKNAARSE